MDMRIMRLAIIVTALIVSVTFLGCADETTAVSATSADGGGAGGSTSITTTVTTTTTSSTSSTAGNAQGGEGGEEPVGGSGGSGGDIGTGGEGGTLQCPVWTPGTPMGCTTWTEVQAPIGVSKLYGVTASSTADIYGAGENGSTGRIIHCDGVECVVQTTPPTRKVNDIMALASDDVWAMATGPISTGNGVVLRKQTGDWFQMAGTPDLGYYGEFTDVWGSSSSDLCILGRKDGHAAVYCWDGSVWTDLNLPLFATQSIIPGDLWGTENELWVVGYTSDGAVICHYDGTSWSIEMPMPMGTANSQLLAIHGSSGCDIVAAGTYYDGSQSKAAALRFDGQSWNAQTSPDAEAVADVWVRGSNASFLVGHDGGTTDGRIAMEDGMQGYAWGSASANLWRPRAVTGIQGSSTVYVVGEGGSPTSARIAYASCN